MVGAQNRLISGTAMRIKTPGHGPEECHRRVGQGCRGPQSLKAEHFLSQAASRTPIMCCERLMEAEQGKGTNVLFGDGHIERVTTRELNRLQTMVRLGRVYRE
jgi:prepilin-type processing-associated H-X9-DG protein